MEQGTGQEETTQVVPGEVQLDIRMVQHWKGLLREVVESLEVSQKA